MGEEKVTVCSSFGVLRHHATDRQSACLPPAPTPPFPQQLPYSRPEQAIEAWWQHVLLVGQQWGPLAALPVAAPLQGVPVAHVGQRTRHAQLEAPQVLKEGACRGEGGSKWQQHQQQCAHRAWQQGA